MIKEKKIKKSSIHFLNISIENYDIEEYHKYPLKIKYITPFR